MNAHSLSSVHALAAGRSGLPVFNNGSMCPQQPPFFHHQEQTDSQPSEAAVCSWQAPLAGPTTCLPCWQVPSQGSIPADQAAILLQQLHQVGPPLWH